MTLGKVPFHAGMPGLKFGRSSWIKVIRTFLDGIHCGMLTICPSATEGNVGVSNRCHNVPEGSRTF